MNYCNYKIITTTYSNAQKELDILKEEVQNLKAELKKLSKEPKPKILVNVVGVDGVTVTEVESLEPAHSLPLNGEHIKLHQTVHVVDNKKYYFFCTKKVWNNVAFHNTLIKHIIRNKDTLVYSEVKKPV